MRGRAALIAAAVAAFVVPIPPDAIERFYSNGVYPRLQRGLTGVSNQVPFALLDVLLAGAAAWWLWQAARAVHMLRSGRGREGVAQLLLRTVALTAAMYLIFLATWGLNYRRVPVPARVPFEPAAVTPEAAQALGSRAVDSLNALHAHAHAMLRDDGGPLASAGPWTARAVDASLADAFSRAEQALGAAHLALPARPKSTLLDPYFRAAGVQGMTNPFFLETLVAGDLLPFERPFVVAHEWSHLAGLGDEGEANLIGWLTCLFGDESAQYSGWLFMYREVAPRLPPPERAALGARLAEGPRADLRAMAERSRRHLKPRLSNAGWRVYDSYLKANRIESGAASYSEVVRLALGTGLGSLAVDTNPGR